ncbi:Lachesin [Pseudolycoriella hygida]|uniref:Lachesin n=1 Tax=Pseudolycoriella hygida TaxID=35572 RepID=A0A9Q0MQL8_9DIPT|nr:Lachesin [Pseudolycoriella hygida]
MSLLLAVLVLTTNCRQISTQRHDSNIPIGEPEPQFGEPIPNITLAVGREAVLTCTVIGLGNHKVGWLRGSDQTVLALQERVVTHNSRITVTQDDSQTWRLRIKQLRETDKGCYMCQINTYEMKKSVGCINVLGNPPPRVTWKRENGDSILIRKPGSREMIRVDTYNGSQLRLNKLERRQMGAYFCIASNDVPPTISRLPPSVQAPSQLLGSPFGSNVELNCHVEASPTPVVYWLRGSRQRYDGTGPVSLDLVQTRAEMLLDGPKYAITDKRTGYKGYMKLVIKSFAITDVGTYHCVSTNSLGKAEGTIRVYALTRETDSEKKEGKTDQPHLERDKVPKQAEIVNVIGGLAEAARGRANSSADSQQLMATKTTECNWTFWK